MSELIISGRKHDLGHGLEVLRILPFHRRRMVGPFIFVDHAGPLHVPTNRLRQADVRPHPHIGLSTVSYLLGGAMTHRDSLGMEKVLHPGEVNWMTAGSGITHSERFDNPGEAPSTGLEFIQTWVALPNGKEEIDPTFEHHDAESLPSFDDKGLWGRVVLGNAYGLTSDVGIHSPLFYVHITLEPGASITLPKGYAERAAYLAHGRIAVENDDCVPGQMIVFGSNEDPVLTAKERSVLMLLGGAPVGERFIWWNFVSSSPERIEQARSDWVAGRISLPPNDNKEFIPLPENLPPLRHR